MEAQLCVLEETMNRRIDNERETWQHRIVELERELTSAMEETEETRLKLEEARGTIDVSSSNALI